MERIIDLFNKIMKISGLTDDEITSIPKEKLIAWDMKYTHLLSKEIAEEVKAQMNLEIDKKKVQLKETIKTLGTHTVPIKLHPKVTAELKVIVTEEA